MTRRVWPPKEWNGKPLSLATQLRLCGMESYTIGVDYGYTKQGGTNTPTQQGPSGADNRDSVRGQQEGATGSNQQAAEGRSR